ncbi:hypothetical protein [Azospirillum sp. Sh1]|uniref:hypothetical protein n=1 Tax=Azospirillum sp. Sh1 TaxID=2607285 RepID=UPI0011EF5878|nr:hypothetical protein [Azospirillum sp. Sh1]KAA0579269.1 hypothetical protein FZ029_07490 [Azospirillum sp. Sh1]
MPPEMLALRACLKSPSANIQRLSIVIPAKAGIQLFRAVSWGKAWIPAFAGMTDQEKGGT